MATAAEQWAHERPDLDVTPILVLGRIARVAQLTDEELRPPFAALQLANGDFDVLAALRRLGAPYRCRPVELSRSLLVTTGGITKRFDRLERRGLVRRVEVTFDGRGKLVGLTAEGLALVDRMIGVHLDNERRLLECLSTTELDQLQTLLGRLTASLEERRRQRPSRPRREPHD